LFKIYFVDPLHWASEYKTCSGKYQSPIDIEENLVTKVNLPLLRFHNIDTLPSTTTIKNNGHTGILIYIYINIYIYIYHLFFINLLAKKKKIV